MKQKLLSFAVPCYNSENYMRHCIETLLVGGDDVEIIIVDDGSKDHTAEIADEYAAEYPGICKAIHQENGGHGEAVNTGLLNATGLYFKVVDSDDWVGEKAYLKVLRTLREIVEEDMQVDMMVCNYVYDKEGQTRKKAIRYRNALPVNKPIQWNKVRRFVPGQYLLMHSVIYRTRMLKECGVKLPKHTFYVDNIYVFEPLPSVNKLYYLNVDFYHYYIGRSDQSVNEQVMISRVDQQLRVTKLMIDYYVKASISNRRLRSYMISYLDIMMSVSSILLIREGSSESLKKKRELWRYLKNANPKLYRRLRHSALGSQMNLPGRFGRKISVAEYCIAQRIFGFN